jgi:hypothetical protein
MWRAILEGKIGNEAVIYVFLLCANYFAELQGATVFLRKTCDRPASRLALRATAFGG